MYSAQNVKGLQRSARQAFPDPITACNNNYALQFIVYWTERENNRQILENTLLSIALRAKEMCT